jgi:eukaryotic-like serine/threonine-protein kinase
MAHRTGTEPAAGLVGLDFEGRYKIEAELGSGGVGVVYRAVDLKLSRPVAIKVMQEQIGASATLRKRFEREAKALALLSHPNIVGIIDFGVAANMPYLVMELLKGFTLAEIIAKTGPLDSKRAFAIMKQILQGLTYVHHQGFVHRDLKPGNVFLQPVSDVDEHVKLLDFGLAKAVGPDVNDEQRLTRSGEVFGTPGYIAPEQFSGAPVDERADIYAAGVILFEMLAGRKPFAGQSNELLRNQLVAPIPSLQAICPTRRATSELDGLFLRMLSRDPNARHQNVAALTEALDALEQPAVRSGANANKASTLELASTVQATETGFWGRMTEAIGDFVPRIGLAIRTLIEKIMVAGAFAVAVISILAILVAVAAILSLKKPEYADKRARLNAAVAPAIKGETHSPKSGKSTQKDKPKASQVPDRPGASARTESAVREATPPPAPSIVTPVKSEPPNKTEIKPSRPPAVNPWTKNPSKTLLKFRKFINAGEYSTERTVSFLRRYGKTHPGDARGFLLLAGLFMNRMWYADAAKNYDLAYRIDPTCRGDQRMLRDLVKLTSVDATRDYASELISKIYGAEALPAIDRAIADAKMGSPNLERLRDLRESLD